MKSIFKGLVVLSMSVFLFSCATIMGDKLQNVSIQTSNSTEVKAVIMDSNGARHVKIPGDIIITKGMDDVVIKVSDKCYQDTVVTVDRDTSGYFWGNIIFGGFLGSSTDFVTGKMWNYDGLTTVPLSKKGNCVE